MFGNCIKNLDTTGNESNPMFKLDICNIASIPVFMLGYNEYNVVSLYENILYTAILKNYNGTTLPFISLLGYFISNIEGSKLGYITWFCVAPSIS